MPILRCLVVLAITLSLHAAEDKLRLVRETNALTPEQERAGFHVPPGFEVQLFASEPMINKPINMAFDARGRLWVSSTVEYPYAADKSRWSDEKGTHVKDSRDAIKILEDTDGDGKADKVTDFADGLNIPTGVVPWHKPEHKAGCIAWSIPNIWYFADSDGDDKADVREVLFGPLGYEKDTHGMCSSFRLGLDGWVYATHGFNNTSRFKVRTTTEHTENTEKKTSDSVSSVNSVVETELELHSGNVFRFKPDGSRVEIWTRGQVNPFGLCWDRYGNLYSSDCHSSPIYQLIRGACYPSFGKPHEGLGFAPVMCEHSHGSTGICGIVYIDGGVWGPEWDDHTFVGNPVTSTVNHDKITFTGSTPKANEQPDFITSDDSWFRPVDLQLGPDNALYIADFYNKIIGHYEVPLEHPGRDKERGRIWRVVKTGSTVGLRRMKPIMNVNPEDLVDTNLTRRHLALQAMKTEHPEKPFFLAPPKYSTGLMRANWWWFELQAKLGKIPKELGHVWKVTFSDPNTQVVEADLVEVLRQAEAYRMECIGQDACTSALKHASSRVRLAALKALGAHPDIDLLPDVLNAVAEAQQEDLVLLHTGRLAIRNHLLIAGSFGSVPEKHKALVEGLAQAVPSAEAANFLLRVAQKSDSTAPEAFAHMARHGDAETLRAAIKLARTRHADSVAPLQAIHNGLSERGAPANAELLQWAQELSTRLLASLEKKPETTWTPIPKWSLQTRKCADGTEAQVLQSMIKGGADEEGRTGVLKSKNFTAPARLTFWINGHCGFPKSKSNDKNLVRVVDAKTGETLASEATPRNDVTFPSMRARRRGSKLSMATTERPTRGLASRVSSQPWSAWMMMRSKSLPRCCNTPRLPRYARNWPCICRNAQHRRRCLFQRSSANSSTRSLPVAWLYLQMRGRMRRLGRMSSKRTAPCVIKSRARAV